MGGNADDDSSTWAMWRRSTATASTRPVSAEGSCRTARHAVACASVAHAPSAGSGAAPSSRCPEAVAACCCCRCCRSARHVGWRPCVPPPPPGGGGGAPSPSTQLSCDPASPPPCAAPGAPPAVSCSAPSARTARGRRRSTSGRRRRADCRPEASVGYSRKRSTTQRRSSMRLVVVRGLRVRRATGQGRGVVWRGVRHREWAAHGMCGCPCGRSPAPTCRATGAAAAAPRR
jgi:hypothetical protein